MLWACPGFLPAPLRTAGREVMAPYDLRVFVAAERVSEELKSAGKQGLKVQDLATRLGTGYGNIRPFFQTTGYQRNQEGRSGAVRLATVSAPAQRGSSRSPQVPVNSQDPNIRAAAIQARERIKTGS